MPSSVRVIGRIDLAVKLHEALVAAGFDAEVVTAGPMAVFGAPPSAKSVDVVVATSIFDPQLWRLAKGKDPLRPMVAVAERRREGVLRGAMLRRNGPDAYVTWPATSEELAVAIRRAGSSASRVRRWNTADFRAALAFLGLMTATASGGVGLAVAGVCLLLGVRYAWNPRWQTAGGVLLTVFGTARFLGHWIQWV